MIRAMSLYAAQTATSVRMSFADKANFALQVGGMIVNDGVFLGLWALFFAGFRSVGGWGAADVALLLGLSMTIVGLAGALAGGYRDLAAAILRGELDALLTQPKGPIPRLLARESIATGWGDVIGGLAVLVLFARLSLSDLPLVLTALAAGLTVYVSAAICFASLAFWARGARSFARDLTDFTILFCSYPGSIHEGAVKVIAYTVLPAGFVVLTPVRLLRDPTPELLAVVLAAAAFYAVAAASLFHLGLARYRRGASPIA